VPLVVRLAPPEPHPPSDPASAPPPVWPPPPPPPGLVGLEAALDAAGAESTGAEGGSLVEGAGGVIPGWGRPMAWGLSVARFGGHPVPYVPLPAVANVGGATGGERGERPGASAGAAIAATAFAPLAIHLGAPGGAPVPLLFAAGDDLSGVARAFVARHGVAGRLQGAGCGLDSPPACFEGPFVTAMEDILAAHGHFDHPPPPPPPHEPPSPEAPEAPSQATPPQEPLELQEPAPQQAPSLMDRVAAGSAAVAESGERKMQSVAAAPERNAALEPAEDAAGADCNTNPAARGGGGKGGGAGGGASDPATRVLTGDRSTYGGESGSAAAAAVAATVEAAAELGEAAEAAPSAARLEATVAAKLKAKLAGALATAREAGHTSSGLTGGGGRRGEGGGGGGGGGAVELTRAHLRDDGLWEFEL